MVNILLVWIYTTGSDASTICRILGFCNQYWVTAEKKSTCTQSGREQIQTSVHYYISLHSCFPILQHSVFPVSIGTFCSHHLAQQYHLQDHLGISIHSLLYRTTVVANVSNISQCCTKSLLVLVEDAAFSQLAHFTPPLQLQTINTCYLKAPE